MERNKLIGILFSLLAFGAQAETPLKDCFGTGQGTQSHRSPPTWQCAQFISSVANSDGTLTISTGTGGVVTASCATSTASQNGCLRPDGTTITIAGGIISAANTGTVTTTGSPANGNLAKFSSSSSITNGNLSGDVTTSGTLADTVAAIQGMTVSGTTGTGNVVFSASPSLTGNLTLTPAGTSNSIKLGASSANPTFGLECLNGTLTTGSCIGLEGGGDNNLYFHTQANYSWRNSANSGESAGLNGSSGNFTIASGGQYQVNGTQIACSNLSNGSASCSTDTTNASNISIGTLASARGGAGSISGALKGNGSGVVSQAACSDLSNGATGCSTATGTSGATIPLLNGTNTWSGVQSFNSGDLVLKGVTSGTITLNAAASAGSNTITFPAGTTNFSATGGTNFVVTQSTSGGALTVGSLPSPSTSLLGGVKSNSILAHNFLTQISTTGTPGLAQPNCGDLSNGLAICAPGYGQTRFTISGCSATIGAANNSNVGTFTSGTTGTCTVVITPGFTATNGWVCYSSDITTIPALFTGLMHQTATNATTATVSGTTVTSDVINFSCLPY